MNALLVLRYHKDTILGYYLEALFRFHILLAWIFKIHDMKWESMCIYFHMNFQIF